MRWPLRYQILLPFAAVMAALLVAVSLLNAYLAARQSFRQTVQRLRDVAHTLADARFPLTDAVLRQAHGLSEAEFVLTDEQNVLAASLPLAEALPQLASTTQWDKLELDRTTDVLGERYFHAALMLGPQGGSPRGVVLHLLYPERSWRDARWQAAYPPLLVGAIALVPVALLAGAIAGRLSRPIVELRRQVGRIAHGDFQPLPPPPHDDELRDLTRSVNTLAGGPSSTMLPLSMNTTRSATSRAKSISWVTTIIVMPSLASCRITRNTSPTNSGSSAEVASSNSINLGCMASERAMATRCCWPPESFSG